MCRCGTKAIIETINDCTDLEMQGWVDTQRFVDAPDYLIPLYPRPFGLTFHFPQHTPSYEALLQNHRDIPAVFTVRDPVPNLKSYARVFLNSFVSRRIDDIVTHAAAGNSIVGMINPLALDHWVMPMMDYWHHWSAMKNSPHKVVDFDDVLEARFVETMNEICDLFGLERTKPIAWSGVGNTESDTFFVGYAREFAILGRKLQLRFSRWNGLWSEPGLVMIGTLRAPALDVLLGPGAGLHVHAKADQLLCEDTIARERDAFSVIMSDPEFSRAMAEVIVRDYELVTKLVGSELEELQDILVEKFEDSYLPSVERFLRAHPALAQRWTSVSLSKAA
jgi:hypothetical protein